MRNTLSALAVALLLTVLPSQAAAQYRMPVSALLMVSDWQLHPLTIPNYSTTPGQAYAVFSPSSGLNYIAFVNHPQRSEFNGEVRQPGICLIPLVGVSLRGGTVGTGDEDRDGLTDIFVTNSDGKRTTVYGWQIGLGGCDTSS